MNYKEIAIPRQQFIDISDGVKYNNRILADLYYQLYEYNGCCSEIQSQLSRLNDCHNLFNTSFFRLSGVKIIKSINLCHNRFCPNCQKVIAEKRLRQFSPYLDELSKEYDLYHVVVTQPNVLGFDLRQNLKDIFRLFGKFVRYLRCNAKIKGIDMAYYGFAGAVRSLEITYSQDSFHPHLHCIIALRKNLNLVKSFKNKYSYDYSASKPSYVRSFSDFEIMLQKIWYLLCNNIKVTKKAIESLDLGYSVCMDLIEHGEYNEVFKYAVKIKYEDLADNFDVFRYLHEALRGKRVIQGYGALYCIKDNEAIDDEIDQAVLKVEAKLLAVETPCEDIVQLSTLLEELDNNPHLVILSRTRIYNSVKETDVQLAPHELKIYRRLLAESRINRQKKKFYKVARKRKHTAKQIRGNESVKLGYRKSELEVEHSFAMRDRVYFDIDDFVLINSELNNNKKYWKRPKKIEFQTTLRKRQLLRRVSGKNTGLFILGYFFYNLSWARCVILSQLSIKIHRVEISQSFKRCSSS